MLCKEAEDAGISSYITYPKAIISCDTSSKAGSQETWFEGQQLPLLSHFARLREQVHLDRDFLVFSMLYLFCDPQFSGPEHGISSTHRGQ